MQEITVVTSVVAGKDPLIEEQCFDGAKFVAYTDFKKDKSGWDIKPAYDRFKSPRRNSRQPKIQIHQYVDTKYSLWVDANVQLLVPAKKIIDEWLKDADIAVCKHNNRDCIYDEALVCSQARLDDPEVIIEQVVKYEKEGFGKHRGMGECTVIARRHTEKVEQFNNYWWSEHCRHSVRDQISFMYAADKAGIKVKLIEPNVYHNPYFRLVAHLTPRPE
jgi:hypothetical protein